MLILLFNQGGGGAPPPPTKPFYFRTFVLARRLCLQFVHFLGV